MGRRKPFRERFALLVPPDVFLHETRGVQEDETVIGNDNMIIQWAKVCDIASVGLGMEERRTTKSNLTVR
jgi:hypothetical protein